MKNIVAAIVSLTLWGCGLIPEAPKGEFNVTLTKTEDTCDKNNPQEVLEQYWILDGKTLTLKDKNGNLQVVGSSTNGFYYSANAPANIFGCIFTVKMEENVNMDGEKLVGTTKSSLSAKCTPNACYETFDLVGVRN